MTWESTTRGATPSREICHWGTCNGTNSETSFYTADFYDIRYFCNVHWVYVTRLMNSIRACSKCYRNHNAEFYSDAIEIFSVKFDNKWWDLCGEHITEYDNRMCSPMDLTED